MGAIPPPAGVAFVAAGATSFRTAASRAGDRLNVLDNGLVADGVTNNSTALAALLTRAATLAAGGGRVDVVIPSTGGIYAFNGTVAVPAGIAIIGLGKPTLQTGSTGALFSINSNNVEIRNVVIDGQKAAYPTIASPIACSGVTGNVLLEDIELINPRGQISLTNCADVSVRRPIVTGSLLHGVYLSGCFDCRIVDGSFQSNVGFGVILTAGCYRNWIMGNRTTANGIELVGVTQDSFENHIIANHAEGTGDNGISITGFKNAVIGNVCKGCQGNGIELYGERNSAVGNICLNNAQGNAGNAGWRAGIAVQGAFGGVGQANVVANNICDDEQATPTQAYGIWLAGQTSYTAWGSGQTISGAGIYRCNGPNLYKSSAAGTTGATPPTHATGTVSDGAVSWIFVRTALAGAFGAFQNEIAGNNVARSGTAKILDASGGTGATANEVIGFQPLVLPSTLTASSIGNSGGVATITLSGTYSISNGSGTTLAISAPNVSGGQQAAASVSAFSLFGFGTVGAAGAGYAVNDIVTLSGGTPTGTASKLKVTAVDGSGGVAAFTSTGAGGGFNYSALPAAGNSVWTGGTGSGFTTTATVWHIVSVNVSAPGSGYTAPPTVSLAGLAGSPAWVATTSATLSITAGAGSILLDGTGTKLGTAGAGGAPVLMLGAAIDATGVRQTLTGSAYTVPANTSLLRFTQASTVATQTITLPAAVADGQVMQFVNYAGAVTALTFSPAVNGWTNGTTLAAFTGLRVRWDAAAPAWYREQ